MSDLPMLMLITAFVSIMVVLGIVAFWQICVIVGGWLGAVFFGRVPGGRR